MLIIIVLVLVYLFVCARVGKFLQDKSASMLTKQICGLVAFAFCTFPLIFVSVHNYVLIYSRVLCGAVGWLAIVYRPKWIIGSR
jgi:hypothetical protein